MKILKQLRIKIRIVFVLLQAVFTVCLSFARPMVCELDCNCASMNASHKVSGHKITGESSAAARASSPGNQHSHCHLSSDKQDARPHPDSKAHNSKNKNAHLVNNERVASGCQLKSCCCEHKAPVIEGSISVFRKTLDLSRDEQSIVFLMAKNEKYSDPYLKKLFPPPRA